MPGPIVVDLLPCDVDAESTILLPSQLPTCSTKPSQDDTSTPSACPDMAQTSSTSTPQSSRRPSVRQRRPLRIHRRAWRRSTMSKVPILSEADYEALPLSIQRKYFSSLERLRIAENASVEHARARSQLSAPVTDSRAHVQLQPAPARNRTGGLHRSPSPTGNLPLRKSFSPKNDCDFSHAKAHWFLSLPDKVRRQHFSREEQDLFIAGFQADLLVAADEKNRPLTSQDSDFDSVRHHQLQFDRRARRRNRSSSVSSPLNTHFKDESFETSIIFIETMTPPTDASSQRRPRRASMRRTLSLTQVPLSPFRNSTSSSPSVSTSFGSRNTLLRPRAATATALPLYDGGNSSADAPAKHYQDPDARRKLKLYLGSPQKFDEAIEFGFPSTNVRETTPVVNSIPPSSARVSHDVQTFLRDDAISCMESQLGDYIDDFDSQPDEDGDTEGELDSPITPSDVSGTHFRHAHRFGSSNFSSFDSSGLPPSWPNLKQFPHAPYKELIAGKREMTLRMTLTRPDLRAKEEDLYGWQGAAHTTSSKDPLALEALPPYTDDMSGSHCPFTANQTRPKSLVGRLLNRMKKTKA